MAYVGETHLRGMMLEIIPVVAPACIAVEVHQLPGPYRWQNWRFGKLDVGVEDYSTARDKADALEESKHCIMIPDGHPFDGQSYG